LCTKSRNPVDEAGVRKTLIGQSAQTCLKTESNSETDIAMRTVICIALAIWQGVAAGVAAQEGDQHPVVVELYTSQGCSACPPADAILSAMATRSDVIALALHVDYWDYIGWKDAFGDPRFTERQRAYAKVAGARAIYTPQMIVAGTDQLVGAHAAELAALITRHGTRPQATRLALRREAGAVVVSADPVMSLPEGAVLQLVRYKPEESVHIGAGENAGRTITYRNIVTDWQQIDTWDGRSALSTRIDLPGDEPAVVILQEPGPGRILAAARLD
jgi:hypothetical protein